MEKSMSGEIFLTDTSGCLRTATDRSRKETLNSVLQGKISIRFWTWEVRD